MGIRRGTLVLKEEWDGEQSLALANYLRYMEDTINNLTNNSHAHAYGEDMAKVITVTTTGENVDLAGMIADKLYGFTFATSSTLTCAVPGHYVVGYSVCFKSELASTHWEASVAVNNVWQVSASSHIFVPTAAVEAELNGNGIFQLINGDTIKLQMHNKTNTGDLTLEHVNWYITRVYF